MQDLPFVECYGSPREMGRQYGEAARDAIRINAEMWVGSRFRLSENFLGNVRDVCGRYVPRVFEELEGLAEGADVPLASILLMNHENTFEQSPPAGCTAMALGRSDRGPVLCKNNDIVPDGRIHVIRKCLPNSGLPIIHVANAGWLSGLDALNAAGLATGHCSVPSPFDRSGRRLDIRLWMYHLAQTCRSAEEFLEVMNSVPLTGKGFNVVVADANGQTCVLEAALPILVRRDCGKEFVYATNHFVTEPLARTAQPTLEDRAVSLYRYGYLRWIEQTQPPKTVEDLAALLRSHEPWAPCRHGGPHVSSTAWSMIALPSERRMMAAAGAPCRNEYRSFGL